MTPMDRPSGLTQTQRSALETLVRDLRRLLEIDLRSTAEGRFGLHPRARPHSARDCPRHRYLRARSPVWTPKSRRTESAESVPISVTKGSSAALTPLSSRTEPVPTKRLKWAFERLQSPEVSSG